MNMIESRMQRRGQGGFTLIELLVVIAILAILAGAAIIGIGAMRDNANETACKADMDTVLTAAEANEIDTPGDNATVDELVTAGLLKKIETADFTIDYTDSDNITAAYVPATGKHGDGLDAACNPT